MKRAVCAGLPLDTSGKLLKHCPSEGILRRYYPTIGIPIPQTRERYLRFFLRLAQSEKARVPIVAKIREVRFALNF
jgi:hypothetical protein